MKKLKVLIAEDEAIIALDIMLYLESIGYEVCPIAMTTNEAISLTKKYQPDVIIMDILLRGDKTGIDASHLIQQESQIPIIYLTGNPQLLDREKQVAGYPFWIINKPPSNQLISEILGQLT